MIKGWKNNPKWVAFYTEKKQKKEEKRLNAMRNTYYNTLIKEGSTYTNMFLQQTKNESI